MASPYPIRAIWPQAHHALRPIVLPLLEALDEVPWVVRTVLADGEHGFATPIAAARYLAARACAINAISIELSASVQIQSEPGLIGSFGHTGMDLLFHLRTQDSEHIAQDFRRFGAALIHVGARAVWFGAFRSDEDSVMNSEDALKLAQINQHPADPLPLSRVDHVSWLMLWPTGAKVDLSASLPPQDKATGVMRLDAAPWWTRTES
jgi:hypothetical protein